MTDEQIKQFDILAQQLIDGSITIEEAIFKLRGGDGLNDVMVVIGFIIFVNWYNSLFGGEAFDPEYLTHQNFVNWFTGSHNSKNAGNGQCFANPPSLFDRKTILEMKQMCAPS